MHVSQLEWIITLGVTIAVLLFDVVVIGSGYGGVTAAALLAEDVDFLVRAAAAASTSRDRQLVVLAGAHLRGDTDLLDVLVRDHLSEHPDNLLAAWIAGRPQPTR